MLDVPYALLGTVSLATQWRVDIFAIRLSAFCMIVYGVIEKNRA
jgi:hypothetical protein